MSTGRFLDGAKSPTRSATPKELQTFRFRKSRGLLLQLDAGRIPGNSSGYIHDHNNPQRRDCCVESRAPSAPCQAAAFVVFFFDFDNGAAVVLAACFTAAQRLICA